MYVWGKMENRKHLPAGDANTTSSASPSSPMLTQAASQRSKIRSPGQIPAFPVPRASSALFNKVDMSGWVDDEAFCPAAGSTSAATALCLCAARAPWQSGAASAPSQPREGHQSFGFGGQSCHRVGRGNFFVWLHSGQ